MQLMSPLALWQQTIDYGEYQPDEVQHAAVLRLDAIQHAFITRMNDAPRTGWATKIRKIAGGGKAARQTPVPGLYMWGGVGRGKTWLMDLFFRSLPGERKLRLHFHHFMLHVHQELADLQGETNPLEKVADRFKRQTDILCFDEFFVSDITDAMLLGTLMQALFLRGITLVATSNIPPDELYHNGLQRVRFLPAIEQIKQHCEVINVDAGIDYRLRHLTAARLWMFPLNEQNTQVMKQLFITLAGCAGKEETELEINYRRLPVTAAAGGVLAADFSVLCGEGRSQNDYIELARRYHTLLLSRVPVMTASAEDRARRFIALVDEFYERHVRLIVAAETAMADIYQGEKLVFEFQRCLSRLQEMQSETYQQLPHLP